ncbi:MAG: hypothetical protein RLZZ450_1428 [Pseudomonadota bacterium]|jgi:hypothetical protein
MATLGACSLWPRAAPAPSAAQPPVVTASVSHAGASAFASDGPKSEPVALVVAPAPKELIVADEAGLSAYLWDGSAKRTLSAGSTLHPRWFDTNGVVALAVDAPAAPGATATPARSSRDLARGARLERISLVDGTRRVLAQLPPFTCVGPAQPTGEARPGAGEPVSLGVQTTSEFKVDALKQVACLDLMDRNTNMATLGMRVRVDLSTGKVMRWMTLGAEDCPLPGDVLPGVPADDDVCNTVLAGAPSSFDPSPEGALQPLEGREGSAHPDPAKSAETSFPFGFDDERVTQLDALGKPAGKVTVEGYEVELASPSGRWLLLGGDPEEGDYMYRRLVLLDRQSGELFALQSTAGAFPKPLKVQGKRLRTPVRGASLLQFEADVRWLGDSAESELLVLGDLLVRPGDRAFSVAGELTF